MYRAGPGISTCRVGSLKMRNKEKKIVMYGRTDQGGNELERSRCVCVCVSVRARV